MLACNAMLVSADKFRMELKEYLEETLHMPVDVRRHDALRGLPAYVAHLYTLYAVGVRDIRFVVLASLGNTAAAFGTAEAYGGGAIRDGTSGRVRGAGAIGFAPLPADTGGHQLHGFRETSFTCQNSLSICASISGEAPRRARRAVASGAGVGILSSASRRSAIDAIAHCCDLGYSAMTVGRAFDDLVAHGLAAVRTVKKVPHPFMFDGRMAVSGGRKVPSQSGAQSNTWKGKRRKSSR